MTEARSSTLITADELRGQLARGEEVILLDVLDEAGAAADDRAKVPGALAVSLATDFSGPASKAAGRRPLPDIGELQGRARAWGLRSGRPVVVYDSAGGAQASRAWWTLRWAGVETVRILDGGLPAWIAAGGETSTAHATAAAAPGDVTLSPGHMPTIEADEAAAIARKGTLLDARGKAAYAGEAGKPATGHIPGAKLAPSGEMVTGGYFKPSDELAAHVSGLVGDGQAPLAVYCGSGNAAAHAIAALHAAGHRNVPLYVGSWSAWSADPSRPVAQGHEPG